MLVRLLMSLVVLGSGSMIAWMSRGAAPGDDAALRAWLSGVAVTRTAAEPSARRSSELRRASPYGRQSHATVRASSIADGAIQSVAVSRPAQTLFAALPSQAGPGVGLSHATGDAGLIVALQKELRRHECFEGRLSGVWDAAATQALARFLDKSNARLPVSRPEPVHLALLRNTAGAACAVFEPQVPIRTPASVAGNRRDIAPPMTLGGPALVPSRATSARNAPRGFRLKPGEPERADRRRRTGDLRSAASAQIEDLLRHPLGRR